MGKPFAMFVPEDSQKATPAVDVSQAEPDLKNFNESRKPGNLRGVNVGLGRQFLPLVGSVVTELSEQLPPELNRQEVVSVGTLALAQAQNEFVDLGMISFEDFARSRIREILSSEFLTLSNSQSRRSQEPEPAQEKDVNLSGCKILVVEDSPMIRKKLRFILERADYSVYEAKSGEEAVWLAQEVIPDLILLDVMLDRMDGFEVCRRLKAIEEFENIPIVFVTGKTETESIAQGFDAGGSDYIGKPFNPHEALPRIRTHLKIRALSTFREQNINQLEKLNKAKDKLLRIASHDLRNPLSAIIGLADLLRHDMVGDMSEEQLEMMKTIHEAADSMMDMLTDLLEMSAMESSSVRLEMQRTDPALMGSSLVNLFKVSSSKKNIELKYEQRGSLTKFNCDEKKIRRVLENFLSNAVKFSAPKTSVKLVVWQDETRCFFDVEDEGPGIKVSEQSLLFKEFSRTSNKPTAGEKSTGLGLSICRHIAEAHDGAVSMENLVPRGARFRLELPLNGATLSVEDTQGFDRGACQRHA
jgi:signal transduction histidine kinase